MKKKLLISAFAMLTNAFTYAQAPVITNSFVSNLIGLAYASGENYYYVSEGNSGANQTWDFYFVSSIQTSSYSNYARPDTVYGYSDFATCTDAEQLNGNYNIFRKLNGNTYSFLGTSSQLNNTSYIRYLNPLDIYHFPLTINTTYSDSYYRIDSVINTPTAFHTVGTCNYLVDGYGTLITAAGTFTNTLRIKAVETGTDTIYTNGVPTSNRPLNITTYTWISASHPGVELFTTGTSVNTSGTYYYSSYAMVTTTGINNLNEQKSIIYPNPTSNTITIENILPNSQIVITNLLGEKVIERKTEHEKEVIDVSRLGAGVYFLNNRKFIKE